MILILGTEHDEHVGAVAREIASLGGVSQVVDLSAFPDRAQLRLRYTCCGDRQFELELPGERIELGACGAAWWRRPQLPEVSPDITKSNHRFFAANETQEALAGLWHALEVFWVNDPARDHVAHRKTYQLRVAQDVGLRIPASLVTNDAEAARSFIDGRGYRNVVYKAFSATEEDWRETRILRPDELALLENVRYAPVIFQEYIEAVHDLRVTIVGDEVFAAAIHSQETEYCVDFRMDMAGARLEAVSLPSSVEILLRGLMGRLGLVYGAIDMRRTHDGEYVFLEINPAGQWLFIEQVTGQPIARALANTLVSHDEAAGG